MTLLTDIYSDITLFTSVVMLLFGIAVILYLFYISYSFVLLVYKTRKIKKFRDNLYIGQRCYVYTFFNEASVIKIEETTVDLQLYTKYYHSNKVSILEKVNKKFIFPKE